MKKWILLFLIASIVSVGCVAIFKAHKYKTYYVSSGTGPKDVHVRSEKIVYQYVYFLPPVLLEKIFSYKEYNSVTGFLETEFSRIKGREILYSEYGKVSMVITSDSDGDNPITQSNPPWPRGIHDQAKANPPDWFYEDFRFPGRERHFQRPKTNPKASKK